MKQKEREICSHCAKECDLSKTCIKSDIKEEYIVFVRKNAKKSFKESILGK